MRKLLAVGVVVGFALPVHAAPLCVNPANTPTCFATIQAAIDAAAAADSITIAAGTYNEAVSIPAGKNGLSLTGNAKKTILDGGGLGSNGIIVDSASVKLASFTLRHTATNGILLNATATGTTITGVTIQNTESDGIHIEATDVVVSGCVINASGDECIQANADRTTIRTTTVLLCDNGGLSILGNDLLVEDNTISQCEDNPAVQGEGDRAIIRNNTLKLSEDGVSLRCDPCTAGLISGNVIAHSQDDDAGIYVDASPGGVVIDGNTITDSTDGAIEVEGSGIRVNGNTIARIGGEPENGITAAGTGHIISNNSITDCHGDGILTTGSGHQVTGNTITSVIGDGIDIQSDSTQVTSNTCTGNGYEGIEISTGTTGANVTGNTASKNRADFCDEGAATVLGTNSFATTSPCSVD